MLISERAAAAHLFVWLGLPRTTARHVLRAGLAGTPQRRPDGSLGYDADAVDALTRWPTIDEEYDLADVAPHGIAVARLRPGQRWSTSGIGDRERERMRGPWSVNVLVRVRIGEHVLRDGYFPVIATLCGFVVAGAEITGELGLARDPITVPLGPPGAWFDRLRHSRWPGGRGGRPLHVWFRPKAVRQRVSPEARPGTGRSMTSMPDPEDYANEADVEEQRAPLLDEDTDEEAAAGSGGPARRDDVDEGDFLEQVEDVAGSDDDYPYGETEAEPDV